MIVVGELNWLIDISFRNTSGYPSNTNLAKSLTRFCPLTCQLCPIWEIVSLLTLMSQFSDLS